MSAQPIETSSRVLDTKYGKNIRARPQRSGTAIFCFLPYMRKPSPIEPNSKPHRSQDSFNVVSVGCSRTKVRDRKFDLVVRASEYRIDLYRRWIAKRGIELHLQAIGLLRRLDRNVFEQSIDCHGLQPT